MVHAVTGLHIIINKYTHTSRADHVHTRHSTTSDTRHGRAILKLDGPGRGAV